MIIRRLKHIFGVTALVTVLSTGCDKKLDLRNGYDPLIQASVDTEIPVGSTEFISIGQFMNFDETIVEDGEGNYMVMFDSGETLNSEMSLPKISLSPMVAEKATFRFDTSQMGTSGVLIPNKTIDFPDNRVSMDILIDSELPEEVIDVRSIDLDTDIIYDFALNAGAVTVKSGFTMDFPEYISLTSENPDIEIIDNHIVRFVADKKIYASSGYKIRLTIRLIDFTRVPDGQGVIMTDKGPSIHIEDAVDTYGDLSINTSDFTSIPSSLSFITHIEMTEFSIISAEARIQYVSVQDDYRVAVDGLPEFLSGKDNVLDFWNPVVKLFVVNDSPFAAEVNADIATYIGTEQCASFHIGQNGNAQSTESILIPAKSSSIVYISEFGSPQATENDFNIKIDGFSDLLKRVPEYIEVSGISISTSDEYIFLEMNDRYFFSMDWELEVPLSFGSDMMLNYSTDLTGILSSSSDTDASGDGNKEEEKDIDFNIQDLSIFFDFENHIPIRFSLNAVPLDAKGNVINKGINIEMNCDIKPGDIDQASTSPVAIKVSCDSYEVFKSFDGLRLNIEGRVDEEFQGLPLNSRQGIRLKDIYAALRGSVMTEIEIEGEEIVSK